MRPGNNADDTDDETDDETTESARFFPWKSLIFFSVDYSLLLPLLENKHVFQ